MSMQQLVHIYRIFVNIRIAVTCLNYGDAICDTRDILFSTLLHTIAKVA